MKKIALLLIAAVAAFACQKPATEAPEITVKTTDLTIPVDGTEDMVVAFNAPEAWTAAIKETQDWCSIAPSSGAAGDASITIIALENEAEEERSVTLVITAGAVVKEVVLTQEAVFVPRITVTPEGANFEATGGAATFNVEANVEYTVSVAENDWLTYTQDGDALNFTAAANTSLNERSVSVTITASDYAEVTASFSVAQAGLANLDYNTFLDNAEKVGAVSNLRIALKDNYLLVSTGSGVHAFNKETGAYVMPISLPEGVTVTSLTNDDAGNILFAADANAPDGMMSIYAVSSLDNLASPELVVTTGNLLANFWQGTAGNLRVKGDINGDAMIVVTLANGVNYAIYSEVKNGEPAAFVWAPSNDAKAFNSPLYGVYTPRGTSAADGILYLAYDDVYQVGYWKSGDAGWSKVYQTPSNGNNNFNAMETIKVGEKVYCAYEKTSHWWTQDYGTTVVLDVTDVADVKEVYTRVNSYFSEGGPYSDVALEADATNLYVYAVDAEWATLSRISIPLSAL